MATDRGGRGGGGRRNRALALLAGVAATWLLLAADASAQLRIVSYNTAGGPRPGMATVLEAIGAESVGGIARPIDILVLQEQESVATTTEQFVDLLNGLYGPGRYARGNVDGGFLGDPDSPLRAGVVYNTQSVTLIEEIAFGRLSGSGPARQTLRYRFRPVGYASTADFYIYSSHYKASTGEENEARRNVEAQAIRANGDALGEGAHLIYAGDFNLRSSSEASYQTLLGAGAGQAFDPIDAPGIWHNNVSLRRTHTQAPAFNAPEGLVGGGMDDRFDFQLVSGELLDGEGLAYLPDSYHAFGNNGTHACCNSSITTGNGAAPGVLSALAAVSDHIPVVADYQLPARMAVSVSPLPSRMLVGANAQLEVSVENTAPVTVAQGADELDFTVTGGGAIAGSGTGTVLALGEPVRRTLAFDTSTAGLRAGNIAVTSDSQAVADGTFDAALSATVLDHANGSFDPQDDTDFWSVDFGAVALGSAVPIETGGLFAVEAAAGLTASLDLDAIVGNGDTDLLTTNMVPIAAIPAGSEVPIDIALDASRVGHLEADYTLTLSDEDLPGAAAVPAMTLRAAAIVYRAADMDVDGDIDFDDIGSLLLGLNDGALYELRFGLSPDLPGDLDGDADLDFDDVASFVALLGGSRVRSVPEPAAWQLVIAALLTGAGWITGPRNDPIARRAALFSGSREAVRCRFS